MLGWLYKILIGNFCNHKWRVIDIKSEFKDEYNLKKNYASNIVYVLQCQKCGNIKRKKLSN